MYYIRDKIEKIFKIDKSYSKILPLNIEKESTFSGHLMMTFMAAVVYKLLLDKIAESGLTTESMFLNLHEQHVCIYDQELITTEPTKKMNDAQSIGNRMSCNITVMRWEVNVGTIFLGS